MKLFRTIPVKFSVEQNHLPRPYASDCAEMRVGVEGDFCLRLIVEMRRDTLDETAT